MDIREGENFSGSLFHIQEKQEQVTQNRGTNEEQGRRPVSRSQITKTESEPPVQRREKRSQEGSGETLGYPVDRPRWIQKEGKGPTQRQAGDSNNLLQKGRQQSQAGSRSEKTEDSGLRDQKTGFTNQRMGRTPQRGPRPKANKTEDTRLSDPEEDHIIKDSRYQTKEKLGAHVQKRRKTKAHHTPHNQGGWVHP